MNKVGVSYLGNFKITSGEVYITDPCYEPNNGCNAKLIDVKNGTWKAYVEYSDERSWGIRVKELMVRHTEGFDRTTEEVVEETIGVDSGQAGIFDASTYSHEGEYDDLSTAYGKCCALTSGPQSAGVLPNGVVSSSGYGDGGYHAFFEADKDGSICSIRIEFIGEDDND